MATITVGTENSTPIDLHYTDQGTGTPVVLIHGWPLSGRSWESQVQPLVEAGHRVITYDRRGFGESSQPWSGYDYDTLAADLAALLDHLDVRGAALVGFSMGGGEVVRYLATYGAAASPRRCSPRPSRPTSTRATTTPRAGSDDATIEQFQTGVTTDRPAFLEGFTTDFFSTSGLVGKKLQVSEAQRQYALRIAEKASPKGTLDCITAFGRTDFRGDVAKVTVPTLVVHGDSDAIVPLEVSGQRAAALIPGAQLHVIEGGPHGINASHAEEFNRVLLAFLAS